MLIGALNEELQQARDVRRNLEIAFSSLKQALSNGTTQAPPDPVAIASPAGPAEKPVVLDRDRTSGIYDDNWIKSAASLILREACAGRNIVLTFFLPAAHQATRSKLLHLAPNFADRATIEIKRGQSTKYALMIPKLADFAPRIDISCETEPRHGTDGRPLGVVLISAEAE